MPMSWIRHPAAFRLWIMADIWQKSLAEIAPSFSFRRWISAYRGIYPGARGKTSQLLGICAALAQSQAG
jgi:hypothetical protein